MRAVESPFSQSLFLNSGDNKSQSAGKAANMRKSISLEVKAPANKWAIVQLAALHTACGRYSAYFSAQVCLRACCCQVAHAQAPHARAGVLLTVQLPTWYD